MTQMSHCDFLEMPEALRLAQGEAYPFVRKLPNELIQWDFGARRLSADSDHSLPAMTRKYSRWKRNEKFDLNSLIPGQTTEPSFLEHSHQSDEACRILLVPHSRE